MRNALTVWLLLFSVLPTHAGPTAEVFKEVAKKVAVDVLTDVLKMTAKEFVNAVAIEALDKDKQRARELVRVFWSLETPLEKKVPLLAEKLDFLDEGALDSKKAVGVLAEAFFWVEKKRSTAKVQSFESIVVDKDRKVAIVHYRLKLKLHYPQLGSTPPRYEETDARHVAILCDISTVPKICALKKILI